MTQFVLDDHLRLKEVHDPISRWSAARFLRDFRSGEVIKDDRAPTILRSLRTPTFITIDGGFWSRTYRDRRYCILYFALRADEQRDIPVLPRRLLRLPDFRTRAARMGKVAQVGRERVTWWQLGDQYQHTWGWAASPGRIRG